jgi:hypothetical protein
MTLASPTPTGFEVTGGGYGRQALAAATWGAIANSGAGRGTTYPQFSFSESSAAFTVAGLSGGAAAAGNPILGFVIATASSAGKAVFYANWSDTTAIAVPAAGYTIRVTPTYELDP